MTTIFGLHVVVSANQVVAFNYLISSRFTHVHATCLHYTVLSSLAELEQLHWGLAVQKCPHGVLPSTPEKSPSAIIASNCPYPNCGRMFRKTSHLRSHLLCHTRKKYFVCSTCELSNAMISLLWTFL